nr:hypothetical protein [Tanacetum cinerariifolium]
MGTVREPLAKGTEGAPHLSPERPRVYSDLSPEEKDRHKEESKVTPLEIKLPRVGRRSRLTRQARMLTLIGTRFTHLVATAEEGRNKSSNSKRISLTRYALSPLRSQKYLSGDEDKAPTVQTMFMANLLTAYPVYDEAGPSYDLDILSEYVKDNVVPGVHSNVSSVPNDAYMMICNDMYEPLA